MRSLKEINAILSTVDKDVLDQLHKDFYKSDSAFNRAHRRFLKKVKETGVEPDEYGYWEFIQVSIEMGEVSKQIFEK